MIALTAEEYQTGPNALATRAQKQAESSNDPLNPFAHWPALNIAAWLGHADHVKALIDISDSPNSLDPEGHSPLSRAVFQGHLRIAKQLIKAGANTNHRLPDGSTILKVAVNNGFTDASQMLLQAGATLQVTANTDPLLFDALIHEHQSIALMLFDYGADPAITFNSRTPLMLAAQNGHEPVVEKLLKTQDNLNQMDNRGHTAL